MLDTSEAILNDIPCILYEGRTKEIPEGFPYRYELRHGEDWGVPATIEHHVTVNYYGVVFSKKPIIADNDDYVEIKNFIMVEQGTNDHIHIIPW